MNFMSDNGSPVAPEIMVALSAANSGAAAGYGADDYSRQAIEKLSETFEREVSVFLVTTGTAANSLNLAALTQPHGAVLVHEMAHVHVAECGAPEFFTNGAKIVPVPGADGKLHAADIEDRLAGFVSGNVHHCQAQAISISQASESGTVYSVDEIEVLSAFARERDLKMHMDGARFANALVALGCTPAEMTWKAGIDALSFGATKNGAMGVEAVILFDADLAGTMPYMRKRAGQLMSKGRYLGAQMDAYLTDERWLHMANHANDMAARLAAGVEKIPGARLRFESETNQVFAVLPEKAHKALMAGGASYYPWGREKDGVAVRLITSFCTTEDEVSDFLRIAESAL